MKLENIATVEFMRLDLRTGQVEVQPIGSYSIEGLLRACNLLNWSARTYGYIYLVRDKEPAQ